MTTLGVLISRINWEFSYLPIFSWHNSKTLVHFRYQHIKSWQYRLRLSFRKKLLLSNLFQVPKLWDIRSCKGFERVYKKHIYLKIKLNSRNYHLAQPTKGKEKPKCQFSLPKRSIITNFFTIKDLPSAKIIFKKINIKLLLYISASPWDDLQHCVPPWQKIYQRSKTRRENM